MQKVMTSQSGMFSSTLETLSSCLNTAAVTLGIFAAVTTALALFFSNKLNKIKDAELKRFQQESMERIAVADSVAAKANLKAEEERHARIKIEKQLAPRTLRESEIEEISNELRSLAPNFSGRKIKVSSYILDAEGNVLALMINDIIFRSGIATETAIGRRLPIGLVDMGVKITGATKDSDFIFKLADAIFARLKTELYVESNDKYKELSIEVGIKPVAGMPKIVLLNKQQ